MRLAALAGFALLTALVGCSSTGGQPAGDAGGGSGQGGSTSGSGGAIASGAGGTGSGARAGMGGSGLGGAGASSGGSAGEGGTSGAGATTGGGGAIAGGGGAIAGASGAAGAAGSAGGKAGAGGAGGTGGATMATPSAGCAKGNPRPPNGTVTVTNDHIYTFPATYDGRTPMPLMIGFHAAGNPINQIQNLTNGSALEMSFVRAFPKSAGSAWVYATDIAKVRAMWDDLLSDYCVDTSHVFATGHSSGAQMIVQMLCNGETRFKGVAPVAASKYCNSFSPVAALYIQGQVDAQRGNSNGADVVQVFRSSNLCASTSVPQTDVATCRSSFDNMQVTPGCITYEGCSVPTQWCSHNDNGYNSTDGHQHGWPCFATSAIAAFFQSLRHPETVLQLSRKSRAP